MLKPERDRSLHSPATLINPAAMHNPHRQHHLTGRGSGQGRWHSWLPWDCNNRKDSSFQATTWAPPLHTQLSFCEKGLRTYPGVSTGRTGFRFPTHLEAKEALPVNVSRETPSLCSPLASLLLNKTSRKELIHSSGAPVFTNITQGIPSDLFDSRPAGITTVGPQYCIYLHTLKAAAWGFATQSVWN